MNGNGLKVSILALMISVLTAYPAHVCAADDPFDLFGLRLGMTPDEVVAILSDRFPDKPVRMYKRQFVYSDGAADHQTDEFIHRILNHATFDTKGTRLEILFSPLPAGGRVATIRRYDRSMENQPNVQIYRDALIQKYGEPSWEDPAFTQDGRLRRTRMRWFFPEGRQHCFDFEGGYIFNPNAGILRQTGGNYTNCYSVLEYYVTGAYGPVTEVGAIMQDIGGAGYAEHEANLWVESLRQEAVKAREARASGPVID